MRFGLVGVLLVVAAPVKTWAVPVVDTVLKGREKVSVCADVAVLDICGSKVPITQS